MKYPPPTPTLPTVPLPGPRVSPASSSAYNVNRTHTSQSLTPPGQGGEALARGVLYDFETRAFTTPHDGRRLPYAILDARAARLGGEAHQPTATIRIVNFQAGATIRCPAARTYVSVRDVLDAIDGVMQQPEYRKAFGARRRMWVKVESAAVGDYRVHLFEVPGNV